MYDEIKTIFPELGDHELPQGGIDGILEALTSGYLAKRTGLYLTPSCIAELLVKIAGHNHQYTSVYDPTCGAGTLLAYATDATEFAGQDINGRACSLARLRDNRFDIRCGDVLTDPHFNKGYDLVLSNPPYSVKWNPDPRYSANGALPPKTKADMAFILHALDMLNDTGRAAIVCFPGVLYRGHAEQRIRAWLVDKNYVDAVIQLPEKLFQNTSISVAILVLDKAKNDDSIVFVDAKDQFEKGARINTLSDDNIEKIYVDYMAVNSRISRDVVVDGGYTLTVSQYVDKTPSREVIDIAAVNRELREIEKENEKNRVAWWKAVRQAEDALQNGLRI